MKRFEKLNREPTSERKWVRKLLALLIQLIVARLWLGLLILFVGGIVLILLSFAPFFQQLNVFYVYLVRQIGTGLLLAGVGTAFVKIFVTKYYDQFKGEIHRFIEEDVTKTLTQIRDDIKAQTGLLVSASASLEAMIESSILRMYSSRAQASEDIAQDLTDPNITRIRVIGISLNDFVRGDQPALHKVWKVINEYILGKRGLTNHEGRLDIKAMIIDPECVGGQLRSLGEDREPHAMAGRLYTDVMSTAKEMLDLEEIAKQNQDRTGVSLQLRLYRLPPILFLCSTDAVSYVQQYYFWASRSADVSIPILRYRGSPESSQSYSLHNEMQDHFDWIWQKASVSASDLLEGHVIGVDKGVYQAGTINVFNDPQEARRRILHLLHHAKSRVYIQGVSLHSFFDFGDLFKAIAELLDGGDVDIRVLLLDPDSDQAYYRSFREHLFENPQMTFKDFQSRPTHHQGSRLYLETNATINNIRAIAPEANDKFQVKLYASAPACFLLMVDESVLVEQYHFGKLLPEEHRGGFPVVLGKDMPLIEYSETPSGLFKSDPLRNPFKLLENHFRFVFERCSRPL